MMEKGRDRVECDESLETVNILQLLENSFILEKIKHSKAVALKADVERKNDTPVKSFKLFLASSNELAAERTRIEQVINRKNKDLIKQGFYLDLYIWEDAKNIGQYFRSQDNYNEEVDACDFFVMLFYSKVGKYTKEEFDRAKNRFDKDEMPRIRIFQKNIDLPKKQSKLDANSRFDFLEYLAASEHFPEAYENIEGLINLLEDAIGKLLKVKTFTDKLS